MTTGLSVERLVLGGTIPHDIEAVLYASERRDFQFGLPWFRHLAATSMGNEELASLHVLRREGSVAAVLPLIERRARWGSQVRSLANFYTSLYTPALPKELDESELAEVFRSLRAQRPRLQSLTIAPLDRADRSYRALKTALRASGLHTFEYFCFGNWYLPVTETAQEYLASRPGEVRSTIKRMSKRFEAQGGRIEILQSTDDVPTAIRAYQDVYQSSWKAPEPFPDFMPGLIRLCAERGWLRLGVAWLDERPIATQLWIVAHGRAWIYKLAYDPAHARVSPGTLLTAALMTQAIDVDRAREIDYMTGDDAYKQSWMSHRRERWGLVAYDPRSPGGAIRLAREIAGRSAKALLQRVTRAGTGSAYASTHHSHTISKGTQWTAT